MILDVIKIKWYSSVKINKIREFLLHLFYPHTHTKIIFIFGCQRSGTTLIQRILGYSPKVKFHGEGDLPYFYETEDKNNNRIAPQSEVQFNLDREALEYITIKPLYESHNAEKLISTNKKSKGIWIFRNYLDVIDSHMHYYNQDAINYIRPFFEQTNKTWLNEGLTEDSIDFLKQFSLDELSQEDAYGLFWILRTSLYFNIKNNNNILLINYENLVRSPQEYISKICQFIGLPYYDFYSRSVRTNAVEKKIHFNLRPEIEEKCKLVYKQLISE